MGLKHNIDQTLWVKLGHRTCSHICMYTNYVTVMLRYDFYKVVLKSNVNYIQHQGQPKLPREKFRVRVHNIIFYTKQGHYKVMNDRIPITSACVSTSVAPVYILSTSNHYKTYLVPCQIWFTYQLRIMEKHRKMSCDHIWLKNSVS
jgi:hypothetical protein